MTKRSILLYCIAAVFLFFIGASGYLIKKKRDVKRTIVNVPAFCLPQAADSVMFCNTQLVPDKPVIVMYFHPECDLCHAKAQQIQQNALNVRDVQWILVSFAARDSINKFAEIYHLTDISALSVLMDSQFSLYDRLKVTGIPTSFIYNRQHRLVTVRRGETKLEKIIQLANR